MKRLAKWLQCRLKQGTPSFWRILQRTEIVAALIYYLLADYHHLIATLHRLL